MAQESWKRNQDDTACQQPEGPVLCVNDCGFFGSATTLGMCSKCYRDSAQKNGSLSDNTDGRFGSGFDSKFLGKRLSDAAVAVSKIQSQREEPIRALTEPAVAPPLVSNDPPKLANRCLMCRKRVGLTGFKCKCDDVFCSLHRHADQHNCTFDYKSAGRDALAKANPVVKAQKFDKI